MQNKDVKDFLVEFGCNNIKYYSLINNYGYSFELNGIRYDARFWANCYGVNLDSWRIDTVSGEPSDETKNTIKELQVQLNKYCR